MTHFRPVFAALLASFLFTACLNGGGSDAIIPPPALPPPPLPADLQTTVPEPVNTDLKALNTLRGQLGLGLLIEDSRLVTVSTKHAQYEITYGAVQSHSDGGGSFWTTEVMGNLNFSGVTATDRCHAAGYVGSCNDTVINSGLSVLPDNVLLAGLGLFAAKPYGGVMLFAQQPRQAGAVYVQGMCMEGCFSWTSLHFGTPTSGSQRQGSDFVLTYPLPDSTVPWISFGRAINLHINAGETLSVDSFTLLDKNGSTVVATLLTQATDPEKFVPGHVAVLVPNAPLTAGMNYIANFWGKRNGTGFSRTWNFSVS